MFLSALQLVEKVVAVVLVAAILVLTVVQVVARYGMQQPFVWTEELARFALIALTFLGSALVMGRSGHIVVDLNPDAARHRRGAIDVFAALFTIGGCLFLAYVAFLNGMAMSGVPAPATRFPLSLLYHVTGAGFTLMALHAGVKLLGGPGDGPAAVRGF